MREVHLTAGECDLAAYEGARREVGRLNAGLRDRFEPATDTWHIDIEGAASERAVAKVLGIYLEPHLTPQAPGEPDVGPWHVRWTRHPVGHLLLYQHDPDQGVFILVVGEMPDYVVVGSIRARDGKRGEWWRDDTSSWWVPQHALRDFDPKGV